MKKPSRSTLLRVARDLWEQAALERQLAVSYRGDDRFGMAGMYFSDAEDFQKIGDLVFCEELQKAEKLARGMDTLPRENVPDSFWRLFK